MDLLEDRVSHGQLMEGMFATYLEMRNMRHIKVTEGTKEVSNLVGNGSTLDRIRRDKVARSCIAFDTMTRHSLKMGDS
jgi:hypothetical protein